MTFTEIIQTKLNDLGFKNKVTGYITPKTDLTSDTRTAFKDFKKTVKGFPDNAYFDLNVLKVLDQQYYKKFPNSSLPKSAVSGWSSNIKYAGRGADGSPVIIPEIVTPDSIYNVKPESDNLKIIYGIAVIGAVLYFMNKKKKKK